MKKTKIIIFIAVLILLAVILVVKQQGSHSNDKIRIGFVAPFSGYAATFGEYAANGVNLALDNLDPQIRDRIEIIKEDDMCSGKDSISAVRKLIEVNRVKYIIGPFCNEPSIATERIIEDNRVMSFSIGLPSKQIANMGPYHFSLLPEIEHMMKAVAEKMIKSGLKRVAVIHTASTFEDENFKMFSKYFVELGGTIVADESKPKGTNDFRDAVLKIKQSNPDSLMLIAVTGDLNNILKQLSEQNLLELPKYSIHAAESSVLMQAAQFAEGMIYPYPGDQSDSQSATEFSRLYQEKYQAAPNSGATNAYDSLNILVEAINKCGPDEVECVRDYVSNLKNYEGSNGILSVDDRGVGTYKQVMLKTVKDGKFVKFEN